MSVPPRGHGPPTLLRPPPPAAARGDRRRSCGPVWTCVAFVWPCVSLCGLRVGHLPMLWGDFFFLNTPGRPQFDFRVVFLYFCN